MGLGSRHRLALLDLAGDDVPSSNILFDSVAQHCHLGGNLGLIISGDRRMHFEWL